MLKKAATPSVNARRGGAPLRSPSSEDNVDDSTLERLELLEHDHLLVGSLHAEVEELR
jgi:hypothetical protein